MTGSYRKNIPLLLREDLQRETDIPLFVEELAHKSSKELAEKVGNFYREHNKSYYDKKEGKILSIETVLRAIFYDPDKGGGFTSKTADHFCLLATTGRFNWEKYRIANPELQEEFPLPKEKIKNKKIDNNVTDDLLCNVVNVYLQAKTEQFQYISLIFENDKSRLNIEEISAPPIIKEPTPQTVFREIDSFKIRSRAKVNWKLEEYLSTQDSMLIIADGGSGKTTLCKLIFCQYAKQFKDGGTIFPIYIEVKQFKSVENTIKEIGEYETVKQLLKGFQILFICDGLDEIKTNHATVIDGLNKLRDFQKQTRIIITSRRTEAVKSFTGIGFPTYTIESSTYNLPKLLIKNNNERAAFIQWERGLRLSPEISNNYFFYTAVIIIFLSTDKSTAQLNKGNILQKVLEDLYFDTWKKEDIEKHLALKKYNIQNGQILRILTLLALISEHKEIFYSETEEKYFFNGILLREKNGFSHKCLQNIIDMCIQPTSKARNYIIELLYENEMLQPNRDGYYLFTNKITEEYFLAKGIFLLCFNNDLLIFDKKTRNSIEKKFYENQNLSTVEIIACLLPNPNEWIENQQLYLSPDTYWKIYFKKNHLNMILFSATLIGERKLEIRADEQTNIVEQLIYLAENTFELKPRPPRSNFFLNLKSDISYDLQSILVQTLDKRMVNVLLEIYKKWELHYNKGIWYYFNVCAPNEKLIEYCFEMLQTGMARENGKSIIDGNEMINYLLKYSPERLLNDLIGFFKGPDTYPGFFNGTVHRVFIVTMCCDFWAAYELLFSQSPYTDLIGKFVDLLILQCVSPQKAINSLATTFITCPKPAVFNTLLITKMLSIQKDSTDINASDRYLYLLEQIRLYGYSA